MLECAANLACVGAEPLGTTNNLNFGNPEKPHIAWQLSEAVRGLGDACRALDAPIVGGNVSLYNEGATGPIYPTPVIGMVGRLPDARRPGGSASRARATRSRSSGRSRRRSARASWPSCAASRCPTGCAEVDIEAVRAAHAAVRDAVRAGALSSAHDIAEGGLAVALAECCLAGGLGAEAELEDVCKTPSSTEAALFGEGPGGFVVSGPAAALARAWRQWRRRRAQARHGRRRLAEARDLRPVGPTERRDRARPRQLARAHGELAELFS